ncbi:MAG: type IV pilin protein [Solirubrobacteraceae bacterium]
MQTIREQVKEERGFSLIELLVVVLIIGVLAAIAIPSFLNQQTKAYDASAKELAHSAELAAETYATDNDGSYAGLTASELSQYDATINTTAGNGNAYVASPLTSVTQSGYQITAHSAKGSDTFTVKRAGGTITRTCSGSTDSGCNNGTW